MKLFAADGTTLKAEKDVFGIFQRGEDLKYIHSVEFTNDDIVTKAEAGDKYQMLTVCGENGSYKEDEEIEGEIPYDAEVRVFMLNCKINHKVDDTTPVPDANKEFLHNTDDGKTEF